MVVSGQDSCLLLIMWGCLDNILCRPDTESTYKLASKFSLAFSANYAAELFSIEHAETAQNENIYLVDYDFRFALVS